jgi:phosphoglucosamine mutase
MKKYFGTDGIRGIANKDLTPELSFKLGRVLGNVFKNENDQVNVLIGRDTRISGELLEYALISGLLSSGANVMRLGVVSTPAVAYLTKSLKSTCGIMISASHNPYPDNGIKIFGSNGYKLNDELELKIEALIDAEDDLARPTNDEIGTVEHYFEGQHKYLAYLQKSISHTFDHIKIAIDCANGATSNLAPHLFANLGADVLLLNNTPNGVNINVNCGSTHIENLQNFVLENEVDLGVAFDGDGDRLIAVDEKGNVVDGDQILFLMGQYLNEKGQLNQNMIVSTVMSNVGFYKAVEQHGMSSVATKVGDRYVLEEMLKNKYNLGGEQSGHIIFLDYATTGDGLLSAIQLVNILVDKGQPLSQLANQVQKLPQVLKNIKVYDKNEVMNHPILTTKIESVEKQMAGEGRVLVRASGTEDLLRIMVEAHTDSLANEYVDDIIEVIKTI